MEDNNVRELLLNSDLVVHGLAQVGKHYFDAVSVVAIKANGIDLEKSS